MRARHFNLRLIYIATLLLSLHYAFTLYINSTYLSQFFDDRQIAILYTLGSLATLFSLILSSSMIKAFGNYKLIIWALFAEVIALIGLYKSTNPDLIRLFFIAHQALPPILLFGLDLFLEGVIRTEGGTGRIRSLNLTISNLAFVVSPFITGKIVSLISYNAVYIISAIFCIFLLLMIIDYFKAVPSHKPREISFFDSIKKFTPHKDLDRLFMINFLLQAFYVIMVIYVPLYLYTVVHFDWKDIGIIFTIMLIPFVLFETPLGRMFDRNHNEKDTLIVGFLIIGISTIMMFYMHTPNLWLWAALLFVSRIGASFVEVGSEYSFFRRVSDRDAGFISIYRMAIPIAYIFVPLLLGPLATTLSVRSVFLVVGIAMFIGSTFSYKLRKIKTT